MDCQTTFVCVCGRQCEAHGQHRSCHFLLKQTLNAERAHNSSSVTRWKTHNLHQQKQQFPHPGCCRCFLSLLFAWPTSSYLLLSLTACQRWLWDYCCGKTDEKRWEGELRPLAQRWGHIYNNAVENNAGFFLPLDVFSTLLCISISSDNTILSSVYKLEPLTIVFQPGFSLERI